MATRVTIKKVLIVEDNTEDKKAIIAFLRKSFLCEITTTESLRVAKALLKENNVFDIIVLDSVIKGFNPEAGLVKDLVPIIREGVSARAKIVRFTKKQEVFAESLGLGITCFSSAVLKSGQKFNENFSLVG